MNNMQVAGNTQVWFDLNHAQAQAHPTGPIFQSLSAHDQATALIRHLHTAADVVVARLQRNSEDTHDIQLVCIRAGGQKVYAGNASYIAMHERWEDAQHMVFGATQEAGEGLKRQDISKCHYLPMLTADPFNTIPNRNIPSGNANGNATTSYMAHQEHWTKDYGPPSTAAVEPLTSYLHRNRATVRFLCNKDGSPALGPRGHHLRDFDDVLPRQVAASISHREHSFRIQYWMSEDPRVVYEDIMDRMLVRPSKNSLNMAVGRWRDGRHIMAAKASTRELGPDCKALEGLTDAQLEANTSWELDASRSCLTRLNGVEPNIWYPLPAPHPDSARTQQQQVIRYTPRVRAALAVMAQRSTHYVPPAATAGPSAPTANLPLVVHPYSMNTPSANTPAVSTTNIPVANLVSGPPAAYSPAAAQPQNMLFAPQIHNALQQAVFLNLMLDQSSMSSGTFDQLTHSALNGYTYNTTSNDNSGQEDVFLPQQQHEWNSSSDPTSAPEYAHTGFNASHLGQYEALSEVDLANMPADANLSFDPVFGQHPYRFPSDQTTEQHSHLYPDPTDAQMRPNATLGSTFDPLIRASTRRPSTTCLTRMMTNRRGLPAAITTSRSIRL